jgi:hypothetical protein
MVSWSLLYALAADTPSRKLSALADRGNSELSDSCYRIFFDNNQLTKAIQQSLTYLLTEVLCAATRQGSLSLP